MSDETSRVLAAGDFSEMYWINPDDLGGGWAVITGSGKGFSAFLNLYSPSPGSVHGVHFHTGQLNRFVLNLPTSWDLNANQTVVYPETSTIDGYAFVMIPEHLAKCEKEN